MLVHSQGEDAPVRPIAGSTPVPESSTPVVKLGLVHLDF